MDESGSRRGILIVQRVCNSIYNAIQELGSMTKGARGIVGIVRADGAVHESVTSKSLQDWFRFPNQVIFVSLRLLARK